MYWQHPESGELFNLNHFIKIDCVEGQKEGAAPGSEPDYLIRMVPAYELDSSLYLKFSSHGARDDAYKNLCGILALEMQFFRAHFQRMESQIQVVGGRLGAMKKH